MTHSFDTLNAFIKGLRGSDLGRVAVLYGGVSAEREISIRSGEGVLAALQRCNVDAFGFDTGQRSISALLDEKVDRVFIALHGRYGEDGTVQGALELFGIPYTGSGVMASGLAIDKPMTKRIWSSFDLPTPKFCTLTQSCDTHAVIATTGLPLAVKPAREGSSLGFTRVDQPDQLEAAWHCAQRLDPLVIAEEFISGREFTCALLESPTGQCHALPIIEIVAPQGQYDYQNKYFGSATKYRCPAPISPELETEMRALSVAAFQAVGCAGWARVDLMWAESQAPTLLEINTSPGMTDHSLVPMAAAQAGFSYEQLVLCITATAALKTERTE